METVFVGETPIDLDQWANVGDDFQKLKIGEIFQLKDSRLSMTCTNCLQEFQYFTEFTLHIQDHYWRGEITQLKEIKEEVPVEIHRETVEPVESEESENEQDGYEHYEDDDEMPMSPMVKCEVIENETHDNSALGWSDDDFGGDKHSIFDTERNFDTEIAHDSMQKQLQFIEGTDYERVEDKFKCLTCDHKTEKLKHLREHLLIHSSPKDVLCPICSKLFATVSYVRKHCSRTHNVRISASKIKESQPTNKPVAVATPTMTKEVKKVYDEDIDYKRVDDKFQCLTCDRKMAKFDHMKEHLLTHSTTKNVYCPFCARAFITESYVRKHVNRTHKMKITADEIKFAQASIDILQVKTKWAIEKDKIAAKSNKGPKSKSNSTDSAEYGTISCLFCAKRFTKPRYAQKHMRLIHAKPIPISEVVNCQLQRGGEKLETQNVDADYKSEQHIDVAGEENETQPEKKFECFECHKQFVGLNSTRIHMKLHSGIKYQCPHCDKLFAMKSYVRDHIVIMHGIKRDDIPKESIRQATGDFPQTYRPVIGSYECYLCKNEYKKRNRLREHMNSHISGPYLCVICGAVYKSTDTLRHHNERHKANPDERIQCPECIKTFPTRRYMLSHYRTIHLNKRRKKLRPLEKKIEFECRVCDKKFFNQHNLRQHMMVHNRDPNELICHICGWEFKERSNLKQHMESHGNNKTTCEVCHKVLSIRYLQEHMKIHNGNKEFQCATCGKQFVSRERLKRHMIRHNGEPKYKCDLCPKAYTRSDKLLYHRRTHDQQMTHTCQSCGKGFFSIKSLRKHENKHYLEENGILKPNSSDQPIEMKIE